MQSPRSSSPPNKSDTDVSQSSIPATQLVDEAEYEQMLRTKARIAMREKKREKKGARRLKLLATRVTAKPLSVLVREKRKRRLLTKIAKSGMAKVGDGSIVDDEEDAESDSGDAGDTGVGKAIQFTAADGKIRIRIQKFVSSAYL